MLKIIVPNPDEPVIAMGDVKETDKIGILMNESQKRGYVMRLPNGKFIISYYGETDFYVQNTYDTLEKLLTQTFINERFVFVNIKQLMDWLQGAN